MTTKTKEQRRLETARFAKCGACGGVAGLDRNVCRACEDEADEEKILHMDLNDCDTVEDLKDFIRRRLLD